ncbi:hypothetical protein [Streptomyces sp. NPDC099088]|uniref:hypothetical protein n=1 Tax=Streptomyces sp. NPDC099088 TaxID=3366101 RepID=UPI00381FB49A
MRQAVFGLPATPQNGLERRHQLVRPERRVRPGEEGTHGLCGEFDHLALDLLQQGDTDLERCLRAALARVAQQGQQRLQQCGVVLADPRREIEERARLIAGQCREDLDMSAFRGEERYDGAQFGEALVGGPRHLEQVPCDGPKRRVVVGQAAAEVFEFRGEALPGEQEGDRELGVGLVEEPDPSALELEDPLAEQRGDSGRQAGGGLFERQPVGAPREQGACQGECGFLA